MENTYAAATMERSEAAGGGQADIVIVGAGLAGLAVALGLHRYVCVSCHVLQGS